MDYLYKLLSEQYIYNIYSYVENLEFIAAIIVFAFELLLLVVGRMITKNLLTDVATNLITFSMYIMLEAVLIGFIYITVFYWVFINLSIIQLPINLATIIICILLADLAYYWEHRFTHRVGFGWATHRVHHSSPYFNISVAYRFGPLDGLMPFISYLPLAIIGFDPAIIFFSEMLVLAYQTFLHTEMIKKLPKPIEAIFNTPSHHRVHHGSNPEYIDKNYAGVFIIWDKLFNTFAEEKAKVNYGLITPIATNNPIKVFFGGYAKLFKKMSRAKNFKVAINYFFQPPEWVPKK